MVSLDLNLSTVFTELPLLQRPEAAVARGFSAVECWWPFEGPVPTDAQLEDFATAIEDAGASLVALNFDAGDMTKGDRGLVSLPRAQARLAANVEATVALAERLGCARLNALYGNREDGVNPRDQDAIALENLAMAAEAAARIGATVLLEALNTFESPSYPLSTTAQAMDVIGAVERDSGYRLAYLYDLYHMQRMEGNLIATIRDQIGRLGHVQFADAPGRSEPGTGEVAFGRVAQALDDAGYEGFVGLEYKPTGASANSFDWLQTEMGWS